MSCAFNGSYLRGVDFSFRDYRDSLWCWQLCQRNITCYMCETFADCQNILKVVGKTNINSSRKLSNNRTVKCSHMIVTSLSNIWINKYCSLRAPNTLTAEFTCIYNFKRIEIAAPTNRWLCRATCWRFLFRRPSYVGFWWRRTSRLPSGTEWKCQHH